MFINTELVQSSKPKTTDHTPLISGVTFGVAILVAVVVALL